MNADPARPVPASLAPEAGAAVRAAQEALDREARKAEMVGDPTAPSLSAMSAMLGSMHKLFVDGTLTIARQIEEAKRPVSDDDIRRLTRAAADGAERRAWELARSANWRTLLLGAACLLLLIGASIGAGWFAHANSGQPPVREVTSCVPAPQAAGGEAYTCTFWARLPTGGQR